MDLWTWSPISVALFVFFIDFGAIVAIRISIERKFYLGKWLAFKLGDSIFLPLYAFFATFVIQQSRIAVSNSIQLQLFLLAIGYILVLFIEYHLVKLRIYTFKQELLPSQLYHTILFGPLFSLLLV